MSEPQPPLLLHFRKTSEHSSGASGGSLHGGASFKVEKAHFCGMKSEPPRRGRKNGAARKLSKSVEKLLTLFDDF